MQTIEVTIYSFHELDEAAKEKARDWYRESLDYPWFSEDIDSIRAFVEHFGGRLGDWSIGEGGGRDYVKTDITQDHFRGRKLKDFSPDHMPTGYHLDCSLWEIFYWAWKRTGDPMYAFEQAIENALGVIAANVEYAHTNEAIDENIAANDYQFTETGRFYA